MEWELKSKDVPVTSQKLRGYEKKTVNLNLQQHDFVGQSFTTNNANSFMENFGILVPQGASVSYLASDIGK